ncbi:class I SAM-dependent methyltransferase [Falsiroseomonas sp. HW251]|uniref:class I SAM-dependent methyltransferase n=1 Tax=Falsiroseomonas sp. HW251 TaxID=3390998 RepID=UPI003D31CD79
MAVGPQRDLSEAVLAGHRAGQLSAEVALMRLVLGGVPAAAIPALVRDDPALAALAARQGPGLMRLEALRTLGADHAPGTGIEATRAMFDRLVAASPEAAVAAYSLGDAATLEAATAELVAWLRGLGLLAGRPRVLDLGCGIGRVGAALAEEAACVLGLDISAGMVAEARVRHAGRGNLAFATCSGRDLVGLPEAGFDLVLAVDVFPYLVQAGPAVAAGMLAEAARVLRTGGHLVILNWSYGPAAPPDAPGLESLEAGTRPLALWDGVAFRLRRSARLADAFPL